MSIRKLTQVFVVAGGALAILLIALSISATKPVVHAAVSSGRQGDPLALNLARQQAITIPVGLDEMAPPESGDRPVLRTSAVSASAFDPDALLIAGTGGWSGTASNGVFQINVNTNVSSSVFSGTPFWGATFDAASQCVLFTTSTTDATDVDGSQLYRWPVSGQSPTLIGVMSTVSGAIRIDGLAISQGKLYGVHQFSENEADAGLYEIDTSTLSATLVVTLTSGAISGIDADPSTGKIYGVNDTLAQLVEITFTLPAVTKVVDYPPGQGDIDGLAIGHGRAYLIPDEPGPIYIYDFGTLTYTTPISSPWNVADVFSGGAYIHERRVYLPLVLRGG